MTTAKARHAFAVRLAAGIAGYCAFINLYSPQSILPLLSEEFGASAAGISTIITVSTLAVALTAPFTGTVADVLGRKRVSSWRCLRWSFQRSWSACRQACQR